MFHELSNQKKKIKRIGRGGKRGTYSGKGQKGQKSRAGHSLPRTTMQVVLKMPKLRGLKNSSLVSKSVILKITDLEKIFPSAHITKIGLIEKGVISKSSDRVKIIGGGNIKKPFIIENIPISKQAKIKVEKAGGSVVINN